MIKSCKILNLGANKFDHDELKYRKEVKLMQRL